MTLKVVTGRANCGKTGWILSWAFAALEAGASPTLVVPNLADVRRMQREISGKAPVGVRVVTPRALAQELWMLHGDGRRIVGDATRAAVIRKILADSEGDEAPPSSRAPGFERLLVSAARLCSPRVAADPLGRSGSAADELVTRLLGSYREEIESHELIEPSWIGPLLAANPPDAGFIAFLRFTTFSDEQLDLLAALSPRSTLCVALTWEAGFAATAANDGVAARLRSSAHEVQTADAPAPAGELAVLAEGFANPDHVVDADGSIVLGEASGNQAECALVAAMAREGVQQGVQPERIAVVFPDLEPRLEMLANALAAEGLEGDFDCPMRVGATPFGRAASALLSLAVGRGARAEALYFLQGPFSDANPQSVLDADSQWRQRRQTDDSRQVLTDVIALGGSVGYAATLCREIAKRPVDEDSASRWQEMADALLSTAVLSACGIRGQDSGAHRSVMRAVAEMASVPGTPFTASDVLDVLPGLSCAMPYEESSGHIQIVHSSRIGARRFDQIIVGGLTERECPLSDRETFATELRARVTGDVASSGSDLAILDFYSLLTRARKRIALVRQTVDSEGAPQIASPLLSQVLLHYRAPESAEGEPGAHHLPLHVVNCTDIVVSAPVFTRGRREARLLAANAPPPIRTVVHEAVNAERAAGLTGARVFSASELQRYLECPYQWFYARVLRPREIDSSLDSAAVGSRAHLLVASFYASLNDAGHERVTPQSLTQSLEIFERTADRVASETEAPQSMGERIDIGRARLWARHVVVDDAELLPAYVPYGHEVAFGAESPLEFAGVRIAGRIDRIDVGPEGALVTDYKSARDVAHIARSESGSSLQGTLYAVAAERLLGRPVVGSVYRSFRSRQVRGFWRGDLLCELPEQACDKDAIDELGFSARVERVESSISRAVEGIEAGQIPRRPRTAESCRYCAIRSICEGAVS